MECPICFEYITISCIPSCTHHFCFTCISKWCNKKDNPKCPLCKIPIREIKFDKEFDKLNENAIKNNIEYINNYEIKSEDYKKYLNVFENNKIVYIDFNKSNKKLPIGLTVKNNKGPGVKIIKVIRNNMAFYSGLQTNDVILYINNLECTNHKHCINILEDLKLNNKLAVCILLDMNII